MDDCEITITARISRTTQTARLLSDGSEELVPQPSRLGLIMLLLLTSIALAGRIVAPTKGK